MNGEERKEARGREGKRRRGGLSRKESEWKSEWRSGTSWRRSGRARKDVTKAGRRRVKDGRMETKKVRTLYRVSE